MFFMKQYLDYFTAPVLRKDIVNTLKSGLQSACDIALKLVRHRRHLRFDKGIL